MKFELILLNKFSEIKLIHPENIKLISFELFNSKLETFKYFKEVQL